MLADERARDQLEGRYRARLASLEQADLLDIAARACSESAASRNHADLILLISRVARKNLGAIISVFTPQIIRA